jgi:hypothetical protein
MMSVAGAYVFAASILIVAAVLAAALTALIRRMAR